MKKKAIFSWSNLYLALYLPKIKGYEPKMQEGSARNEWL